MRILVTGSRNWDNEDKVIHELSEFIASDCGIIPPVDGLESVTLVHGACPKGADALADKIGRYWAERWGLKIERHPAKWREHAPDCSRACWDRDYCKRAGFRRNSEMVLKGANVCLAFIRDGSPGATMTADLAESWGIPVRRIRA